jgi:hypothetical protein
MLEFRSGNCRMSGLEKESSGSFFYAYLLTMEEVRKIVREILSEILDKTDVYTSFLAAKKHLDKPNMYLHFTNVYKLGINPKKSHADPHAIYFYPVRWILDESNWHTFQYAVTMDYFFLCQVDTKNFLKIDSLTWPKVEFLMNKAGLYDYWQKFMGDFSQKSAGRNFWEFLDMMNVAPSERDNEDHRKLPQVTWNAFWKTTGYDGFTDTKGVVNSDEPHQIGVFNRSKIKIIESGPNKDAKGEYMKFYQELIDTFKIDVKEQGYIENGKVYRIYGLVNGKALDIRIYPEEYGAVIYYSDDQGNLYKAQTEYTFDAAQGRSAIISKVSSAIESAGSGAVDIERLHVMSDAANKIFDNVSGYEFKSFRTSFGSGIKPMQYSKRDDKNTNLYMFNGGLNYEEGELIVDFTFSVSKQVLFKDPLDIFGSIVDANPGAGEKVWYSELRKYGINPENFEYENTEEIEEPVFRFRSKVTNPEETLKSIQNEFEKWILKYKWPPGNPNAKAAFMRRGTDEKVRAWFYKNIKNS